MSNTRTPVCRRLHPASAVRPAAGVRRMMRIQPGRYVWRISFRSCTRPPAISIRKRRRSSSKPSRRRAAIFTTPDSPISSRKPSPRGSSNSPDVASAIRSRCGARRCRRSESRRAQRSRWKPEMFDRGGSGHGRRLASASFKPMQLLRTAAAHRAQNRQCLKCPVLTEVARRLLELLRPQRILVCGRTLWEKMPATRHDRGEGDDLYLRNEIQAYALSDGTPAWCLAIRHPSRGFSWRNWHPVIRAFLADPVQGAQLMNAHQGGL